MQAFINNGDQPEFYTTEKCYITEVFNSALQQQFSLARARVTPGGLTTLHALNGTDEVYYVLSGTGEMEVDGKIIGNVAQDSIVYIPANSSQRIKNTGLSDLVFLCICAPRFEITNYQELENP